MNIQKFIYTFLVIIFLFFVIIFASEFITQGKITDHSIFKNYTSSMEKDLQDVQMTLQSENDIDKKIKIKFVINAFVLGSIFSISMVYLYSYMSKRRNLSALFFSLAGIFLGIRLAFTKEMLFMNLLYDFSPEAIILGDLATGIWALLFFLLFNINEFFPNLCRKLSNTLAKITIVYGILVIVLPLEWIIRTFFIYQFLAFVIMAYVIVLTIYTTFKRRQGSYLNLIGFFILFALSWNDVLHYSDVITSNEFITIGVFVYFLLLAFHLAQNISRSFDRIESLTVELQQINTSLETKIKHRTEELQTANESLKKMETARRNLLASVSHELNTPLTFIQGHIKAVLDGVVSRDDSSYLRAAYNDTKMMVHMINDLQELSQMETGHIHFQFSEHNIEAFIKNVYEEHKSAIPENYFQFVYRSFVNSNNQPLNCLIDPIRIRQVMSNFIINAQKFTPRDGTIKIEIELPSQGNKREVKISVSDTGVGIDQEDIPYVFERFYKVSRNGDETVGTGLGLAICKEIVEIHEGKIGVVSGRNKGSAFYFTLPVKDASFPSVKKLTKR